jgi:hypothetical protein
MGMAAPKRTAAPQAGLAALAQPAQTPQGKSPENMGAMMAIARKMSDAQLAQVLQGKSLDVPQYVAMTEAMGRKQLRTAVEGAQASQQQPSLKEKLMGEYQQEQQAPAAPQGGGVAAIPAPNMAPQNMAGGGIIAFDEGGEIPRFNEGGNWFTEFRDSLYSPEERRLEAMKRGRIADEPTDALSQNQINSILRGKTPGPAEAPMPPASMQKEIDDSKMRLFKQEMADKEAAANAKPSIVSAPPVTTKKSGLEAIVNAQNKAASAAEEPPKSQASQDYLAKLEGLTAKQREGLASIRSQGGGEALMQLAAGILSSPTLAGGLSKGMPLVASTAAASRKEQRDVEKSANEYDLNLAKAREAVESGDMDRALKYKIAADQNRYHMGMLDVHNAQLNKAPDMLRTLQGIAGNPQLEALYNKTGKTDVIPRATALKEWNDLMPMQQKKFGTFDNYYAQLSGGTIGGGGPDLQSQAAAELARRNK